MAEVKNLEKTLALIKPDAVRAGNAESIMQKIELAGFTITNKARFQLTQARAEDFYGEHKGKPFFEGLVQFMTSGPIWALCLVKENAIQEWRQLMGPTDSNKARETSRKSMRALYGTDGRANACHGSDSPASAERELRFFFPNMVMEPLPTATYAADYIEAMLQPALVKGLTALCKEKPSAKPLECIAWLANWLLVNNPNQPRIVAAEELPLEAVGPENPTVQIGIGVASILAQGEQREG
eukprot:jgi/Mesvir1/17824/Mv12918-RA.1